MKGINNKLTKLGIWVILLVGCWQPLNAEVSVVVNTNVSAHSLSTAQLRKIFTMRQTVWPDGQGITVFVLDSDSATHRLMCTDILNMFPYQVERLWNKLAYSGLGDKPISLKSEQEMVTRVSTTPGAIGYVDGQKGLAVLKYINIVEN